MYLNQLIEINEKGIVANSVNFKMMDNPDLNQRLCEGFIFNYNEQKPEISTVGILDRLRQSFHSKNNPNIHLVIQQYGKGKSHFAVTIANYFQNSFESAEVQGILYQIENATSNKSEGLVETLKLYKKDQRQSHLVICLSGDRAGDLKKQFLQALIDSLEQVGIKNSVAQHLCQEPLRYLESLCEQDKLKVNKFLKEQKKGDGDIENIISLLRQNNSTLIKTAKDIFKFLTGFNPDFTTDIDIEAILEDILNNLCYGENSQFSGILILFDELNYYLQCWARDEHGSGGTALQNITNICNNYKGKIAFLSFTQIHPDNAESSISAFSKESYSKLSTRLTPKESTYYPESSLELVIKNIIIQRKDCPEWKVFNDRWKDTLLSTARNSHEKRIKIYRQQGWTLSQFYRDITEGCFPLHPLTTYLLCALDFTQDRTAIEFIKDYVKKFVSEKTLETQQGNLNYIYPVTLVDTFLENFKRYPIFDFYKKAEELIINSENSNELIVLKALFLYYTSGEKLAKLDQEHHEDVIESLTGLSAPKIKEALESLINVRDVIYYQKASRLYQFYEGVNPASIEEQIEIENKDKEPSFHDLIVYIDDRQKDYLGNQILTPKDFVSSRRLREEDWQFEYKIYSIDGIIKELSNNRILKNLGTKGIFAYVLAGNKDELNELRRRISQYLAESPIKNYIAVAISNVPTEDLAKLLLNFNTLKNKDSHFKLSKGTAYQQLYQRWNDELNKRIINVLKECTFHCVNSEKLPLSDQYHPQKIISALLEESYYLVPPIEGIDKMRSGHATGVKIIVWLTKQLFNNNLTPQIIPDKPHETVIDQLFVSCWHLLKKSSQSYTVQKPTEKNVRAAWDKISEIAELDNSSTKVINLQKIWQTLKEIPYGYNELTFVALLAGWLTYHRQEVILRGADKLNLKKRETSTVKDQSLKDWANTEIWQKPKDFIEKWVCNSNTRLIRRQRQPIPELPSSPMDYDQAQKYLNDIEAFLESNTDNSEIVQMKELVNNQSRVSAEVKKINDWFTPVKALETLPQTPSLSDLLPCYFQLQQSPPPFSLTPNTISVCPSQGQRDQFNQAFSQLSKRIEQIILQESQRAKSLSNISECNNYELVIGQDIELIRGVNGFPPHLKDLLNNALTDAAQRKIKIKEQIVFNNIFQEIQQLYDSLNYQSTQQEYTQTRQNIETLAKQISSGSVQQAKVGQFIQDIDEKYRELNQKIDTWEERILTVISKSQILEINNEIARLANLFTEEESQSRINNLNQRLEKELLEVEEKDEAEKILRAELENVQAKVQRIRDLPDTKLPENFQVFQELLDSRLSTSSEKYESEHKKLKEQGYTILASKISNICDRNLNNLDEYESLNRLLESSFSLLNQHQDFDKELSQVQQALQKLEVRKIELLQQQEKHQKQAEDLKIFQEILKLKPTKTLTVHNCEEAIMTLEQLKNQLNHPEEYNNEIERISIALSNKVQEYTINLSNVQQQIINLNEVNLCRELQTRFLKQSLYYDNSSLDKDYHDLSIEIQRLLCLLQICELSKEKTIENFESQLKALSQWHKQQNDLSSLLKERFQVIYHEIENQQQKLIQQRQKEAAQWINELEKQVTIIYSIIDDQDKLDLAEELLKQIEYNHEKHQNFLNENSISSLHHIKEQCQEEKSKSKANQILVLFKELPRLQRQDTYDKLAQYLSED